jgi:hypothetical protein
MSAAAGLGHTDLPEADSLASTSLTGHDADTLNRALDDAVLRFESGADLSTLELKIPAGGTV